MRLKGFLTSVLLSASALAYGCGQGSVNEFPRLIYPELIASSSRDSLVAEYGEPDERRVVLMSDIPALSRSESWGLDVLVAAHSPLAVDLSSSAEILIWKRFGLFGLREQLVAAVDPSSGTVFDLGSGRFQKFFAWN